MVDNIDDFEYTFGVYDLTLLEVELYFFHGNGD